MGLRHCIDWSWRHIDDVWILWVLMAGSAMNIFLLFLGRIMTPLRFAAHSARLVDSTGRRSGFWRSLSVPLALGVGNGIGAAVLHCLIRSYGRQWLDRILIGINVAPSDRLVSMLDSYGSIAVGLG